ncbi:MAG: hypothetical protein OP8BY_2455 [Candidatus Saccharicenans subterraneus]|uniref:Outer membrane protein beta-barrel domain-containing protein n=1 Tax=Candidatus Saccharicenans subterraneus TaxID=2508984 RepID=A0A3E2BJC8_9BACT|nr:MAG: hypothetical protein OP8BY_2455 [Candidatus Saccharicenans subterraneum]
MKKVILGVLVMSLLLAGNLTAARKKAVVLSWNSGIMTYIGSQGVFSCLLLSEGIQADLKLSSNFQLSPELQLLYEPFRDDYMFINPGLVLNFTSKKFLAGAGVILPVLFEMNGVEFGRLSPKFNIGFIEGDTFLAFYMITDKRHLFRDNLVGFVVGFKY